MLCRVCNKQYCHLVRPPGFITSIWVSLTDAVHDSKTYAAKKTSSRRLYAIFIQARTGWKRDCLIFCSKLCVSSLGRTCGFNTTFSSKDAFTSSEAYEWVVEVDELGKDSAAELSVMTNSLASNSLSLDM